MKTKYRVLAFHGYNCYYCKKELTVETSTIDHYIPKSKGGSNDILNTFPSCYKCNIKKGNNMPKFI